MRELIDADKLLEDATSGWDREILDDTDQDFNLKEFFKEDVEEAYERGRLDGAAFSARVIKYKAEQGCYN